MEKHNCPKAALWVMTPKTGHAVWSVLAQGYRDGQRPHEVGTQEEACVQERSHAVCSIEDEHGGAP